MAKPKHGEQHEEHVDESWLLPYSDMMTLLLALFIVMFAMSSVNEAQYNAMMESMYTAFGGTADQGSPVALPYPDAGLPNQPADPTAPPAPPAATGKGLSDLYLKLNKYVEENNLSSSVGVAYEGDRILVTLKNDVFFEPGSAELSPEMLGEAQRMAQLLYESEDPAAPFDVIVAGHTDNVYMNTPQYPSNWYLSVYRAVNFLVAMLENSNLDPTRFSSRGYGEYVPVASNETAEGRQQNRRVELLVTEQTQEADALQQAEMAAAASGPDTVASAPASGAASTAGAGSAPDASGAGAAASAAAASTPASGSSVAAASTGETGAASSAAAP